MLTIAYAYLGIGVVTLGSVFLITRKGTEHHHARPTVVASIATVWGWPLFWCMVYNRMKGAVVTSQRSKYPEPMYSVTLWREPAGGSERGQVE